MNMSVDIDNFIREQKSKIATERHYLSNQNLSSKRHDSDYTTDTVNPKNYDTKLKSNFSSDDNFIFKMKEGENMKNKYKQELRNDFTNTMEYNKYVGSSPRGDKMSKNDSNDGLLRGLGYSNSATKRKENLRNQEYNEFKKIEEQNFRNRFLDKKSVPRYEMKPEIVNAAPRRNPITFEGDSLESRRPIIVADNKYVTGPPERVFESKLDILEKKVDDLRRFKIQDIDVGDRFVPSANDNDRGVHWRALDETENQLRQIDQKYDESKARIINTFRHSKKKPFPSILDDERIFEDESLDKAGPDKTEPDYRHSIIPLGRTDEEARKRQKQDQYRRDLQDQMKEKLQKSRSAEFGSEGDISFFDRFGGNRNARKAASARVVDSDSMPQTETDYAYYATRNPLEDYENISYVPSSFSATNITNIGAPARRNDTTTYGNAYTSIGGIADPNKAKGQAAKDNYGDELKKQIEERKVRKEIERKRQEEYERRKNEEIMNYDPFGRGGGGAPLKDVRGETIADLKNYKFDTNITIPPTSFRTKSDYYSPESPTKPPLVSPGDISTERKTYARGGHGIFGQALSDEAKIKNERYKEELEIQIDIKKRQREIEKEQERIREAKELEKLEKEQKQIQLELENERKIQVQKEIERNQRLEESRLAAKEKKVRAREEVAPVDEQPQQQPQQTYRPIISPYPYRDSPKPKSPVIMRATTPIHVTQENNEITNKLQMLRNEIKNRAAQVEKELARQTDEVEIYDARLDRARAVDNHPDTSDNHNSTIFQSVLDNKGPLSVRRGYFRNAKPAGQKARSKTEAYLDEHLRKQERLLERMGKQDFSPFELGMDKMNPRDLGIRPQSQMSNQLESDTNFITFNQSREFPLRTSLSFISDQEYPFLKQPQSPKPFRLTTNELGSNTSLNIDDLTRKNKQRLRKLQKSQLDNETNQSPEDILNRIRSLDNNEPYSFNAH